MNKNLIISALVGGLILFIWQFISWALINIHQGEQLYTPHQDTILNVLQTHLSEDGTYFLPTAPTEASEEEKMKVMESSYGKPWAQISFHKSMENNMSMNMIRGFLVDVLAAGLLFWILSLIPSLTIARGITIAVSIGLIGYMTSTYLNDIWFEGNSIMDLIDVLVSWVLCGAWISYMVRKA